jgi:hypothetical protein
MMNFRSARGAETVSAHADGAARHESKSEDAEENLPNGCTEMQGLAAAASSVRALAEPALRFRGVAATFLALLVGFAAPAAASAEEPLPACTGDAAGTISIEGLPSNLVEGKRYEVTVLDSWEEDVEVSLAVEGQAPYWTGTVSSLDYGAEPNVWIRADDDDGPLVIVARSRHTVDDAGDQPLECEVAVTRTLTHSPPPIRVMCSSYDGYGNYPSARFKPSTCTLGQQNWSYHAQGFMALKQMRWRQWGKRTATARAIWRENMGYSATVRVKFYRLRDVDGYWVYTRAGVRVLRANWSGGPRNITVKLPTHEG